MTATTERAPAASEAPAPAQPKKERHVLANLGIAVIVLYCLIPFYWMVVSAFRRPGDQFSNAPIAWPISMENLFAVFSPSVGFWRALLNSLIVAGTTTLLTLIIGITTAYALARLDFRFKNLVLAIIVATSMFPTISLIVPLLKLFTNTLGWINTYQAMILPTLSFALPLAVFNLTAFFRTLPFDLEQAAMVDGCTPGQAFRKIIIPLAAPGVFTTAIITFIMAWNEFIIALSMVNENSMKTATVAIATFTGSTGFDQPFGTQMAAGVVVTVPLVVAVLVFQRRIIAGLTTGGVK
ncbi:MAG: ABC transporter permease subunit [Streptosporangiales bacterium]|nr:ABC transporter permease subunit [Streptosporangiales bacterium]